VGYEGNLWTSLLQPKKSQRMKNKIYYDPATLQLVGNLPLMYKGNSTLGVEWIWGQSVIGAVEEKSESEKKKLQCPWGASNPRLLQDMIQPHCNS